MSIRSLRRGTLLALLLGMVSAQAARSAEPVLIRDFHPGTDPYQGYVALYNSLSHQGVVYFVASDPAHGRELWRTDGTAAGTWRLTDICRGPCDSEPDSLEIFRGEIYFSADDGFSGRELWASRLRPGTARRVSDLCPGPCSGRPDDLTAAGGRLFFEGTSAGGRGLWISDGTRPGTTMLAAPCTDAENGGDCIFWGIHPAGDLVLFQMNDSRLGVWRSDGTREGTGPFNELVPEFPSVASFVRASDGTLFAWTDNALWWTDGTAAGTRRLKTAAQLGLRTPLTFSARSTIWNGLLVAVLSEGDIVRSDGTPAGTFRLGRLPQGSNLIDFAPLDDVLLFALQSPDVVWRTKGTPQTTRQVTELPGNMFDIGRLDGDRATVCLQISGDPDVMELWVSDGTDPGTRRVLRGPGVCGLDSALTAAGRVTLWTTWDFRVSDGTAAGSSILRNFGVVPASGGPLDQLGLNGKLLFSARVTDTEAPLFLTDGTRAGTRRISREARGAIGFVQVGDRIFFQSRTPTLGSNGLWQTRGTAASTVQVDPGISGYGMPMPVGSTLFFSAARAYGYHGQPDLELFRSDGTREGTGLVEDINPFQDDSGLHHICYDAPSSPGPGVALGNRLIFAADDGLNGRELWESDGTAAGTRLLMDIDPRRLPEPPNSDCGGRTETGLGSDPRDFLRFGDGVLFTATDEEAGRELWWTDGTAAGTRRVADLRPGAEGSEPHDLVVFRGEVWFIARADEEGEGLWRTDGTPAGTILVRRLTSRGAPAWARSLTATGDKLFFVLFSATAGPELWVSQGTAPSTRRAADIRPGPEGSYPQSLTAVGDLLVFAADDGVHGLEPWRSNGTAAGTARLGDINPGFDASSPGPFTPVAGGLVVAGADDGTHGREPWAISVEGDKK